MRFPSHGSKRKFIISFSVNIKKKKTVKVLLKNIFLPNDHWPVFIHGISKIKAASAIFDTS